MSWESDVFDTGKIITGTVAVRYLSDIGRVITYVSRSVDGTTWTDWEELTPYLYLESIIHISSIAEYRFFKVRIELIGFTHMYNIQIIAQSASLNADTLNGNKSDYFVSKEESFFGNGNVTFTYSNGRIAQMSGNCGNTNMTVTLSYDNSGLVSQASYTINGSTTTYSFTYTNGRISQITASRN
jgi:hypothetical protein